MRDYFTGLAGVVIAVIVALALIVGIWVLTVVWAPWKGEGDVRRQTLGNGTYRIASYDHFFDLCASAQTLQQNAATTKRLLRSATGSERERQSTVLQAQTNQLQSLVNTYNADAAKTGTSGQFKSSTLPYTLNASQEITCTA